MSKPFFHNFLKLKLLLGGVLVACLFCIPQAQVAAAGGTIWARCSDGNNDALSWEKDESISTYRFTCGEDASAVTTGVDPGGVDDDVSAWERVTIDCGANDFVNQQCRYDQDEVAAQNAVKESRSTGVDSGQTGGATGSVSTPSDKFDNMLQDVVNLLSGVVVLAMVISLMFAGFQYMTAGGNANQVAAAKNRIVMVVISFILFVFAYGFLQWLVPGGIFG